MSSRSAATLGQTRERIIVLLVALAVPLIVQFFVGSRERGREPLGRLVNLYAHRSERWVKVGRSCSDCGAVWINWKRTLRPV